MFEHSIKVPRLYKIASKLVKDVKTNNISIKKAVFENKHVNKKALYALIMETLQHEEQINFLFRKAQLIEKESRIDEWLARVLVTELLWGKKQLPGDSKPVQTILAYQQVFNAHLDKVLIDTKPLINKSVNKPRYVRVNTLALSVNEAVEGFRDEGWNLVKCLNTNDYEGFLNKASNLGEDDFMVDIHVKELLLFPPNTQFYQHSAYKNGSILLQDKASCLPVKILNPQPGSVVLDMCAAPGMKTSQIAAMINNEGTVYAVERDVKRIETLRKFVENSGATCVQTINKDVLTVNENECPNVEYILVDPSCSGSGITDRVEFNQKSYQNDSRIKSLQGFQIKILKHALRSFSNVKKVVYSTCSLNPKENEEVVKEVISSNQRFKLIDIKQSFTGVWFNYGSEEYGDIGKFCLYAKPEEDLTNGFFVAAFERLEEGEENPFFNSGWSNFVHKTKYNNEQNHFNPENENKQTNDRWKRRNKKLAQEEEQLLNNEQDINEENTNNEENTSNEENEATKKGKMNKHCGEEVPHENQEENEEEPKKKKRKNKVAENGDENKIQNKEESTENEIKKSKKKKRKSDNETLEEESAENKSKEDEPEIKKPKKSKKQKHTEDSIQQENLNEEENKPKSRKKNNDNETLIDNSDDKLENKKAKRKSKKISQ